ncbi:DUF362 domain-containing protein [candidate division KSB1 bacterium]|nr:DUF362 domain-containing protein [candidate division KSB1 bacterium]
MATEVSIQHCPVYKKDLVFEAIDQLLKTLGGIETYVNKGQTVLLKPNMLSAKSPDMGVTTHPFVLEALINQIKKVGGEVWIGDSPSGVWKGIQRYWKNTGFLNLADRTGAKLVNFEADGTVERQVAGRKYHLAKTVFDADVVINVPKMKTHGLTLYTGAVKNLYGTLPGFQKAKYHKEFPNPTDFSQVLLDIYECVQPALTIMDAITAMEGNGPATGDLKDVGLLLASTDGVALDTVANAIMGFKQNEVPTTRLAGERGLGENNPQKILIKGVPLLEAAVNDFNLPSTHLLNYFPKFLVKWVGRFIWVRPSVYTEKCTGCGVCSDCCPVDAIEMKNRVPVTDYDQCINCLCCNESCPEGAVYQKMSWLARRFI